MRLLEFALTPEEIETGHYDPAEDNNRRQLDDVRRPSLTLKQLNRVKKMKALKTLENLKREDLLSVMYGSGGGDDSGGGFGF